ncbi:MAG TPA: hypothetical protein VGQ45_03745 [Gaiellales bacterium]|jgi:hypothetical protein|nr:hypothetical protein [Gaiellales bacterium]
MTSNGWENNWKVVAAPGAGRIDLRRGGAASLHRDPLQGGLGTGDEVVICASAPGADRRCRRFAAGAGLKLDRSYLAFPSAAAPAYLIEDSPEAIALFARSVLVVPPRARFALAIEILLLAVRRLRLWWLVRLLAPGRLAVGSKL